MFDYFVQVVVSGYDKRYEGSILWLWFSGVTLGYFMLFVVYFVIFTHRTQKELACCFFLLLLLKIVLAHKKVYFIFHSFNTIICSLSIFISVYFTSTSFIVFTEIKLDLKLITVIFVFFNPSCWTILLGDLIANAITMPHHEHQIIMPSLLNIITPVIICKLHPIYTLSIFFSTNLSEQFPPITKNPHCAYFLISLTSNVIASAPFTSLSLPWGTPQQMNFQVETSNIKSVQPVNPILITYPRKTNPLILSSLPYLVLHSSAPMFLQSLLILADKSLSPLEMAHSSLHNCDYHSLSIFPTSVYNILLYPALLPNYFPLSSIHKLLVAQHPFQTFHHLWTLTLTAKKLAQLPAVDMQQLPGSSCLTVPKHINMQKCGVWMTAYLENAACQLQAVEPVFFFSKFIKQYVFLWATELNQFSSLMSPVIRCVLIGPGAGVSRYAVEPILNPKKRVVLTRLDCVGSSEEYFVQKNGFYSFLWASIFFTTGEELWGATRKYLSGSFDQNKPTNETGLSSHDYNILRFLNESLFWAPKVFQWELWLKLVQVWLCHEEKKADLFRIILLLRLPFKVCLKAYSSSYKGYNNHENNNIISRRGLQAAMFKVPPGSKTWVTGVFWVILKDKELECCKGFFEEEGKVIIHWDKLRMLDTGWVCFGTFATSSLVCLIVWDFPGTYLYTCSLYSDSIVALLCHMLCQILWLELIGTILFNYLLHQRQVFVQYCYFIL
ncbi:hypothetical protein VP01_2799g1 [Puccinia sorghi]|uniref:Uncharacterized protein n=1 Tax=Puccinia sorghi TaxID=27349 RepID=A0A0L6V4D9_9BASI|nr:hypothetical protein VP01_2799g1 [Puccinia sorghi]